MTTHTFQKGYPPIGGMLNDALTCTLGASRYVLRTRAHARTRTQIQAHSHARILIPNRHHVVKGAHQTFHLGEKNGGWGKYRDDYEGYNRLSRKMAESTMVCSLARSFASLLIRL